MSRQRVTSSTSFQDRGIGLFRRRKPLAPQSTVREVFEKWLGSFSGRSRKSSESFAARMPRPPLRVDGSHAPVSGEHGCRSRQSKQLVLPPSWRLATLPCLRTWLDNTSRDHNTIQAQIYTSRLFSKVDSFSTFSQLRLQVKIIEPLTIIQYSFNTVCEGLIP